MAIDSVLDQPLVRQLCQLARDIGFRVERNDEGVPLVGGGVCIYSERVIRISTHFGVLDTLPVLVHELAHAILHGHTKFHDVDARPGHEAEARWVVQDVMRRLGLNDLLPPDHQVSSDEPPTKAATLASERILNSMPPRVVHYLASNSARGATDDRSIYDKLVEGCLVLGLSLVRVQGWTAIKGKHIAGTRTVSLAEGLSEDEVACVLAHEISHAIQHPPGTPNGLPTSEERSRAERVAHGAAAVGRQKSDEALQIDFCPPTRAPSLARLLIMPSRNNVVRVRL